MILLNYSTEKWYNVTFKETDITQYQQSLTNIQTVRSLNSVQTDYFCLVIIIIFRGWILATICNKKLKVIFKKKSIPGFSRFPGFSFSIVSQL